MKKKLIPILVFFNQLKLQNQNKNQTNHLNINPNNNLNINTNLGLYNHQSSYIEKMSTTPNFNIDSSPRKNIESGPKKTRGFKMNIPQININLVNDNVNDNYKIENINENSNEIDHTFNYGINI